MKRMIFGLGVGLALAGQTDNFPIIRNTGGDDYHESIQVRKFEDGPNTCYVVYAGRGTAISCVARQK